MSDANSLLRSIPAMDQLLNIPMVAEFSATMGREFVKETITAALDSLRREICDEIFTFTDKTLGELVENRITTLLHQRSSSTLKSVVNATGVIVHTNLGRAPLANKALEAVSDIARTYSTLEYSLEKGGRGERNSHVEWLICHICGAEAALAVNNNAAAVLLALSTCAAGREVIVSNGELVEIGGSFRIPEILSFSTAIMKAVGCTNSTRIADYRGAVTENTAVLLKVHTSNYRIEGFTSCTSREELAELAAACGLVFIEDLGSGLLCPLGVAFTHPEHSARNCLEAGVDIVTFSGDKLLGGPQIGVVAGSKQIIDRMRNHPLLRAMRADKMTLAAFEATLRIYLSGRRDEIPVIKMIETDEGVLLKKARQLCAKLKQTAKTGEAKDISNDISFEVVQVDDAIGGGAFPTERLSGFGVGIQSASRSAESLALAFRTAPVPIIPGIRDGRVILHVRTLLDGDEERIISSFSNILSGH